MFTKGVVQRDETSQGLLISIRLLVITVYYGFTIYAASYSFNKNKLYIAHLLK